MMQKSFIILFLFIGNLAAAEQVSAHKAGASFSETLAIHLHAIQKRDLQAFISTITTDDNIILIYPNGTCIEGRAAYLKEMEDWFADPNWRLTYSIRKVNESKEMATALLLFSYDEESPGKPARHLDHFLFLVFQNQSGEWRLIHDQNTVTRLK